jgi:hypothetical protein
VLGIAQARVGVAVRHHQVEVANTVKVGQTWNVVGTPRDGHHLTAHHPHHSVELRRGRDRRRSFRVHSGMIASRRLEELVAIGVDRGSMAAVYSPSRNVNETSRARCSGSDTSPLCRRIRAPKPKRLRATVEWYRVPKRVITEWVAKGRYRTPSDHPNARLHRARYRAVGQRSAARRHLPDGRCAGSVVVIWCTSRGSVLRWFPTDLAARNGVREVGVGEGSGECLLVLHPYMVLMWSARDRVNMLPSKQLPMLEPS